MSHISNKEIARQSEIDQLIAELSSKDHSVRENARTSLSLIGKPAIMPLVEALPRSKRNVRLEIAKALADMLDPEAAPVLVAQLENDDPEVRWLASEGLIALGREGLEPLLNALISKPDFLQLRMSAHHVLADLYAGEIHESESGYAPLYVLNDDMKGAIRPILIALESMDHAVILPPAVIKALEELRKAKSTRQSS